ncbi:metal ABC transporter permease [Bacillaceae bacterium SIJ1]|uniref:metal ABC transporter permease n=1 Tax=Litoribacterium kuwaitense TaxID=1398745 RepID=UPI0013EAB3E1|nr:metal ABC transporter permease [Litoribacterium kuwaitense]NGP44791.1 metal ABC transporter permease [Litoribacterium kuwaitense]
MFFSSASNFEWVLFSALALGVAAGMVGTLSYWKKQSLMSDALAHAALPGVVIAFLLTGEKNLPILILGAAITALLGAFVIQGIQANSRLTSDTSMGIVLSSFFGLGLMLLTITNRVAAGSQSGLDSFIFGQAASMVRNDVIVTTVLATVIVLAMVVPFKEWKLYLFDPGFARGLGLSSRVMSSFYTLLLVLTIVVGIQAVGVILIAALLIIPSTSARYWTHSFSKMMFLSALFGGFSGIAGTYVSSLGAGWPTGPFMVLIAAVLFIVSMVFGAEKGLLIQHLQHRRQKIRVSTAVKEVRQQ